MTTNATSSPGTSGTIVTNELQVTLNNLNESMGSMARILELMYKANCPPGNGGANSAAHERRPKVAERSQVKKIVQMRTTKLASQLAII